MDYEFHVGDYVETVDGDIGYITSIEIDFTGAPYIDLCASIKNKIDIRCCEYHNFASEIPKYFRRIGRYDFIKKDKKIEKITLPLVTATIDGKETPIHCIKDYGYQINFNVKEFTDKINELVDTVNELREK